MHKVLPQLIRSRLPSSTFQAARSFSAETTQELLRKITEDSNSLPPPLFTKKCCEYYKQLDRAEKTEFFNILSKEFDVDRVKAMKQAQAYIKVEKKDLIEVEKSLQHYLEPKYNLFFDRIHQLPNGLKILADMRRDLLDIMSYTVDKDFANLEEDIRLRLKKYIIGFLKMERITWEQSSGELIEKICAYEAVHAVKDWKDIKRRLGPDRRVYAFFEKNVFHEPLVFVHVALLPEMSDSVQKILDAPVSNVIDPKYGICYSITTQQGLGGINLGNYLIKQVVERLKQQFPQIHTFATLSPIPGFRKWLISNYQQDPSIRSEFKGVEDWQMKLENFDSKDQAELKEPLMRLCSRYILNEKRSGKNALDPVANFHLRNGACAHQIHWSADTSSKGIQESFGIMINYNYITDKIESNHRHYQSDGTIAVSEPEQSGYLSAWINKTVY